MSFYVLESMKNNCCSLFLQALLDRRTAHDWSDDEPGLLQAIYPVLVGRQVCPCIGCQYCYWLASQTSKADER